MGEISNLRDRGVLRSDRELPKCEFCGKNARLWSHHIIPRWLSGTETMEVCRRCHNLLESRFNNFIKYGTFKPVTWRNWEKDRKSGRERNRRYKHKVLFGFNPRPYVTVRDELVVTNLKEDIFCITHGWAVNHQRWNGGQK